MNKFNLTRKINIVDRDYCVCSLTKTRDALKQTNDDDKLKVGMWIKQEIDKEGKIIIEYWHEMFDSIDPSLSEKYDPRSSRQIVRFIREK